MIRLAINRDRLWGFLMTMAQIGATPRGEVSYRSDGHGSARS
jgi:hypothetical protein